MTQRCFFVAASLVLGLAPCALMPQPALAQQGNDPLANVPKLLQVLNRDGFEVQPGRFQLLDPPEMACGGLIPSAWYNNVQPYLGAVLQGAVGDAVPWEKTNRLLPLLHLLRQDEAIVIVGSTPPPMAYFSFQTFVFGRYNTASNNYDPATGGFFRPYEIPFAYLGDTVNSLTIQTTGSTPFNRPMAFISTGNHKTQERIRAALRAAGYPDAIINTEALPSSLVRFGYENGDQFLLLWRTAIAAGGEAAMKEYQQRVVDPTRSPLRIFRVRPRSEFPSDPLPVPVLRTRGTGRTEMDLFPTMVKLRQKILADYGSSFEAEQLDTLLPDVIPEGYPAFQRDVVYLGPGYEGSAGYGRDANYWASPWFDLPADGFAIIYGVNHAATGKATYSSANVYLHPKLAIGAASADSADFAANPDTASTLLPGEPGIDKFFVWKVARDCHGEPACMEAKVPAGKPVCAATIAPDVPVRIFFRQYAEPETKIGPADAELLYERVIVFRPK